MKVWILLCTLILLFAGCASVKYVNVDSTDAVFEDDKAECTQQTLKTSIEEANLEIITQSSAVSENSITTQTANTSVQQMLEQCLQSKGWIRETEIK